MQSQIALKAMVVAVAIACSAAFLTPIAYLINVLMIGPSTYTPRDFFEVGSGMLVVSFVALMVGMMLFWRV